MHGAPSVSYPVGRSAFGGLLHLAAWLAGAVLVAAWARHAPALAPGPLLGAAASLGTGLFAWRAWRDAPSGLLAWDGQGWHWADGAGESAGELALALDLQSRVLVRWRDAGAAGRGRWLWLEKKREREAWVALRRAVYSTASTDSHRSAPFRSATT